MVNSPRPSWKMRKMMIVPAMDSIVLHECEWPFLKRNDPTGDTIVCKVFCIIGLI